MYSRNIGRSTTYLTDATKLVVSFVIRNVTCRFCISHEQNLHTDYTMTLSRLASQPFHDECERYFIWDQLFILGSGEFTSMAAKISTRPANSITWYLWNENIVLVCKYMNILPHVTPSCPSPFPCLINRSQAHWLHYHWHHYHWHHYLYTSFIPHLTCTAFKGEKIV